MKDATQIRTLCLVIALVLSVALPAAIPAAAQTGSGGGGQDDDSDAGGGGGSSANETEPNSDFSFSPADPEVNETVRFDDLSTDDGNITAFEWAFGDGSASGAGGGNGSLDASTNHTYDETGNYTACLTVRDDDGNEDTACHDVPVGPNTPPELAFDWSPTYPDAGETVTFFYRADDVHGIASISWSWGDGSASGGGSGGEPPTTVEGNTTHTYDADGLYHVCMTATDGEGQSATVCHDVRVGNQPPVAEFDTTPQPATAGEEVRFEDDSHDPDGFVDSWVLDFGDGTQERGDVESDAEADTTHVYDEAGNYSACLTVWDEDAADDTTCRTVTVEANTSGTNEPPVADFSFSPDRAHAGEPVTFTDLSRDPDGMIDRWIWEFGDGAEEHWDPDHYLGPNTTHVYDEAAHWVACLTVQDRFGAEDTLCRIVEVLDPNQPPLVDGFTAAPPVVEVGEDVDFQATASDGDGDELSFRVDFGDGATLETTRSLANGTVQAKVNASHAYAKPGSYRACVDVTDDDGAHASACTTVEVVAPLVADFDVAPSPARILEPVEFTDRSTAGSAEIVAWHWEYDDGLSSDEQHPTHRYVLPDTYHVCLIVEDDRGRADAACRDLTVQAA